MDYELTVWHTDGYPYIREIYHDCDYAEVERIAEEYICSCAFVVSYDIEKLNMVH